MSRKLIDRTLYCGRKPKGDDFDDVGGDGFDPNNPGGFYNDGEYPDEDEDEDEEVDFDKPSFRNDQIWNDYADDLDFDE